MRRLLSSAFAFVVAVHSLPAETAAQDNSILMLLPTEDRELEVGGESAGALSTSDYVSVDGYLLEAWQLQARAGQSLTVDLISDDFDPRLYVAGPGFARTLSDDDSGGGCNSRLTVTFLENGTFRVVAASLGGETGTYSIRASERPEPVAAYNCGDANPAVLTELDTEDRVLEMGSLEVGILGASADVIQDGRPGEAWRLVGSAGDRVSIVLESNDFDTYLYVTGPGLGEVLTDDDGGGDTNSKIDVTLPEDGSYTVVASAYSSGSFGAYNIRVEEPLDPSDIPIVQFIEVGETATGQLFFGDAPVFDGRRGQVWGFEATAGQTVTIDLESDDFDTYLYVTGPGMEEPTSDDDGGDDMNSRLVLTFPETGTYRIVPSSYGSSDSGTFTLSVAGR